MLLNVCVNNCISPLGLKELHSLILYVLETVKVIPTWLGSNELAGNELREFIETLARFIRLSPILPNSIELCFQAIDLIVDEVTGKLTGARMVFIAFLDKLQIEN